MGKQTILIVDDEPDFVTMLKQTLQDEGYTVEVAYNGVEAIEKVKKNPPDAIVLDIMMPEKDGFQVCSELRFQTMSAQHSILIPRRWIWRQMIFCSNRHPSRISWKASDHF